MYVCFPAMPKKGPEIIGGKNTYRPGDFVHVNCTSGPSKPATEIMWYINGEKVRNALYITSDYHNYCFCYHLIEF